MNQELRRMLIVDDDPGERELILAALQPYYPAGNGVDVAGDGVDAVDYIYRRGKFEGREPIDPVAVLLDLKMPRMDGHDVLKAVKGDPAYRHIPIITFTSSEEERDIRRCYDLGGNGFLVKPMRATAFREVIADFVKFWCIANKSV